MPATRNQTKLGIARWRSVGIAIIAVWLAAAISGCALMGYPAVELGHDPKLDAGLRKLANDASGARLADLTDFEWDIVYVFGEGAPADEVNHAAGTTIVRRGRFVEDSVSLFIFKLDGKVVRHLRAPELVLPGVGDRDIRVEPAWPTPKPVSLELVYPDR